MILILNSLKTVRLSVAGPQDLTDIIFRIVDQSRYAEVSTGGCWESYDFYSLKKSLYLQVLDLLYANFHTDEPMSKALKIFDGELSW